MAQPLLDVVNLSIDYLSDKITLHAVENVSFQFHKGSNLALVGESGCGKTTVMLGLLRLLPAAGRIVSGEIHYGDTDLLQLTEEEMRHFRWQKISIVFQGAMNALNPVQRIGDQIAETVIKNHKMDRQAARKWVDELLELVGVSPKRANQYPHQYSGGMRQRAIIAMALACSPDILIADEPTTALDVMVQAQLLELLQSLQKRLGLSIILVTHDLGVVAEVSDTVLVMYSGKMVEFGSVDAIYNRAQHPYTQRLLQAFPDISHRSTDLASIEGYPPPLDKKPLGCYFEPRCHCRIDVCSRLQPQLIEVEPGHLAACHLMKG